MKPILVLVVVVLLQACNSVNENSNSGFTIKTEKSSFTIQNQFSSKTLFINNLGKDVSILNSSCGGPLFTLEKYENDKWITAAEQPFCDAIPSEPLKVMNGKEINLVVSIEVATTSLSGQYRMKFNIIQSSENDLLDEKYLLSNSFQIIKQ